jgi:hypothetical protein
MVWGVAGLRPNFFSSGLIFLAGLAQESWRVLAAVPTSLVAQVMVMVLRLVTPLLVRLGSLLWPLIRPLLVSPLVARPSKVSKYVWYIRIMMLLESCFN